MVLPLRIELRTSPLPRECSTTELRQHPGVRGDIHEPRPAWQGVCRARPPANQDRTLNHLG